MKTKTSFSQLYDFPGFRARARFKSGVFKDPIARVVELARRQKKRFVPAAERRHGVSTTGGLTASAIWMPADIASTWISSIDASHAGGVKP
jgi:hypothetical protein